MAQDHGKGNRNNPQFGQRLGLLRAVCIGHQNLEGGEVSIGRARENSIRRSGDGVVLLKARLSCSTV